MLGQPGRGTNAQAGPLRLELHLREFVRDDAKRRPPINSPIRLRAGMKLMRVTRLNSSCPRAAWLRLSARDGRDCTQLTSVGDYHPEFYPLEFDCVPRVLVAVGYMGLGCRRTNALNSLLNRRFARTGDFSLGTAFLTGCRQHLGRARAAGSGPTRTAAGLCLGRWLRSSTLLGTCDRR